MSSTFKDDLLFTVPAVPVAQPRHRIGTVAGKAMAFEAKKAHPIHAFKATVRMCASEAYGGPPAEEPLSVFLVFVLPRPKAKCWKTRPTPREPHVKKPDCDNLAKGVMDALTGLLWKDDSQVFSINVAKYIASGDEQPHCNVAVFLD